MKLVEVLCIVFHINLFSKKVSYKCTHSEIIISHHISKSLRQKFMITFVLPKFANNIKLLKKANFQNTSAVGASAKNNGRYYLLKNMAYI